MHLDMSRPPGWLIVVASSEGVFITTWINPCFTSEYSSPELDDMHNNHETYCYGAEVMFSWFGLSFASYGFPTGNNFLSCAPVGQYVAARCVLFLLLGDVRMWSCCNYCSFSYHAPIHVILGIIVCLKEDERTKFRSFSNNVLYITNANICSGYTSKLHSCQLFCFCLGIHHS